MHVVILNLKRSTYINSEEPGQAYLIRAVWSGTTIFCLSDNLFKNTSELEVIKLFSCLTQMRIKFFKTI